MDWLTLMESLATGALGGTAAVFGLSKFLGNWWLERQKARYSTELEQFRDSLQKEQRRVQAEIDRWVFVTRAQFETEFTAMKELFGCLSEVRLLINSIRPFLGMAPKDDDLIQAKKRLLEKVSALERAYDSLLRTVESLQPFYPPELHSAAEECRQAANMEIFQVRTGEDEVFLPDWFKQGEQNCTRFSIAYTRAAEIIRDRIARLAVLPSR
jgi:hypothetical protein